MKNCKQGASLKDTAKQINNKKKSKANNTKVAAFEAATVAVPASEEIDRTWTTKAINSAVASSSKSKWAHKHSAAAFKVARSSYSKPPSKTAHGRYYNWNADPCKSALTRAVEAKLE